MINKPRVNDSKGFNSNTLSNSRVKWCSVSSPRPTIGIDGVLYVNKERNMLSIWSDIYGCYIDFFGSKQNTSETSNVTTNNTLIVKSIDNQDSNNSYSFNLINDNLVITGPDGVIQEITLPNTKDLENKIRSLNERIDRLEELLN